MFIESVEGFLSRLYVNDAHNMICRLVTVVNSLLLLFFILGRSTDWHSPIVRLIPIEHFDILFMDFLVIFLR